MGGNGNVVKVTVEKLGGMVLGEGGCGVPMCWVSTWNMSILYEWLFVFNATDLGSRGADLGSGLDLGATRQRDNFWKKIGHRCDRIRFFN